MNKQQLEYENTVLRRQVTRLRARLTLLQQQWDWLNTQRLNAASEEVHSEMNQYFQNLETKSARKIVRDLTAKRDSILRKTS